LKYFDRDEHGRFIGSWFVGRVGERCGDLYRVTYAADGDAEVVARRDLSGGRGLCRILAGGGEHRAAGTAEEQQQVLGVDRTADLWTLAGGAAARGAFREERSPVSEKMAEFYLFCYERHRVWVRSNRGDERPWTRNPVLHGFFFCNVFRELDRGTAYFHSAVVALARADPRFRTRSVRRREWLGAVAWRSYVYRLVNRIETLEATGFPDRDEASVREFAGRCQRIADSGAKVFTGAHQTSSLSNLPTYLVKSLGIWDASVAALAAARSHDERMGALERLPGVSRFFGWQILCDLEESGCFEGAVTTADVQLGPGAVGGLGLIFPGVGNLRNDKGAQVELARVLVTNQMAGYDMLGLDFPTWNDRCMALKEVEHALCEFLKYDKLASDSSGRKRTYESSTRISLDLSKLCRACGSDDDMGMMCDLCRELWCRACDPKARPAEDQSWTCRHCRWFQRRVRALE
jgi:hypothetical protein